MICNVNGITSGSTSGVIQIVNLVSEKFWANFGKIQSKIDKPKIDVFFKFRARGLSMRAINKMRAFQMTCENAKQNMISVKFYVVLNHFLTLLWTRNSLYNVKFIWQYHVANFITYGKWINNYNLFCLFDKYNLSCIIFIFMNNLCLFQ